MFKVTKATLKDIKEIQSLVADEVKNNIILYRNQETIATNIRSYLLIRKENKIIASVALHIYSIKLAEFRSLIVQKKYRGQGLGQLLIKAGINEAKELGLKELLVLTYQANFFKRLGFIEIEKSKIPDKKIWADCINCKNFSNCDEVALIKKI
jgi:amino-acid N-acetyltransferase